MLGDVICEGSELFPVWPGRQVQRLGDFQSLLQVAPVCETPSFLLQFAAFHNISIQKMHSHSPSALIHGQKGGAFVLRVVCDHHTHEKGQPNHAAEEDVNVNVDRVNLLGKCIRGIVLALVGCFFFGNFDFMTYRTQRFY